MEILKPDCLYIEHLNSLTSKNGMVSMFAKNFVHHKGGSQDTTFI